MRSIAWAIQGDPRDLDESFRDARMTNYRIESTDLSHPALQVALPLVSVHDGDRRCIGTAVSVYPGLAITAAHVVQDWADYQERRDGYRRKGAKFSVAGVQCHGGRPVEWMIDHIWSSPHTDVAFLRFK